jgi:hypothetical protein
MDCDLSRNDCKNDGRSACYSQMEGLKGGLLRWTNLLVVGYEPNWNFALAVPPI